METGLVQIDENFYFNAEVLFTAEISNKALREFALKFDTVKTLGGDYPIFLDTNILLGYYGMSKKERIALVEFINKYADRIKITKQIEQEFLRNRLSVIKKDFWSPLNKISTDYAKLRQAISGQLLSFKESQKTRLSHDYPELWKKLLEIESAVNGIMAAENLEEQIKEEVEKVIVENKSIAFIDDLLEIVAKLKCTKSLTQIELTFLKEQYEAQLKRYKDAKDVTKWRYAMPGCGEKKEDGSGDFIIFHEMLKFMKEHATSCIFITNDIKKEDWLQKNNIAHCHYIEHAYHKTDQILFILNAQLVLPEVSFSENSEEDSTPSLVDGVEKSGASTNKSTTPTTANKN